MRESASSLNNLNIRKPKRSYNFDPRVSLGLGIKMISGFKRSRFESFNISKKINDKEEEKLNTLISIKLENTKKRYSQPLMHNIKTNLGENFESLKRLKRIEYNHTESEKSEKTIKLKQSMKDGEDSFPMTINSLPLSLKKKLKKELKI